MNIIDVWINCPDEDVAQGIGSELVRQRLAACANIYPPISSSYHWKGEIETATEIPLLVKTRDSLFDDVCNVVQSMHPYETPSIIGVPVLLVNKDYEEWIKSETLAD